MQVRLNPRHDIIVDGENNTVVLDALYSVSGDALSCTLEEIKKIYGDRIYLLPLSGVSGGGGIFQVDSPGDGSVVGLHLTPTLQPRISRASNVDITEVSLDEIIFDAQQRQVYAGSSITLDQLNQALTYELGAPFKVLGADLTSYTYAQVGATFMTGGMGPQRRYFSESVNEIALYNGRELFSIKGELLNHYAGTYGWSGLVAAVCCKYHELPETEFAFTIPVNSSAADLAGLLQHLAPFTYLKLENGLVNTLYGGTDLILGLEHISLPSMQPMLSQQGGSAMARRARGLVDNCAAAGTDGLMFVNGYSNLSADEFLMNLMDNPHAENYTIAGTDLEHTEMFTDPEEMRALRESIPAAARTQSPEGRYVYKGHTDANIRLNPSRVGLTMRKLWLANQAYVYAVDSYFRTADELQGEILVYGHLNPVGVDPHNRVTFACDSEKLYQQTRIYVENQRNQFFRVLGDICMETDSVYIGGEKSAGTEHEIFSAFAGVDHAPASLKAKFLKQSEVIRSALPMFNWRALAPYV